MPEPIPIHLAARPAHAEMESNSKGSFRILQRTDFHTDVSEQANRRTWRDVHLLIGHCEPDLLAVTGDIWCGDELSASVGLAGMKRDLALLGDLGVPWAFTWGNHDYADEPARAHERIPQAGTPAPRHAACRGATGGRAGQLPRYRHQSRYRRTLVGPLLPQLPHGIAPGRGRGLVGRGMRHLAPPAPT